MVMGKPLAASGGWFCITTLSRRQSVLQASAGSSGNLAFQLQLLPTPATNTAILSRFRTTNHDKQMLNSKHSLQDLKKEERLCMNHTARSPLPVDDLLA